MNLDNSTCMIWVVCTITMCIHNTIGRNQSEMNSTEPVPSNMRVRTEANLVVTGGLHQSPHRLLHTNTRTLVFEQKEEDGAHIVGVIVFVTVFIIIVILLFFRIPQRIFDSYQRVRITSPY
ncbi:Ba24 [Baboon cytomegalovirus]|nr:Ba24 [Baboon cytomegalovirus]